MHLRTRDRTEERGNRVRRRLYCSCLFLRSSDFSSNVDYSTESLPKMFVAHPGIADAEEARLRTVTAHSRGEHHTSTTEMKMNRQE